MNTSHRLPQEQGHTVHRIFGPKLMALSVLVCLQFIITGVMWLRDNAAQQSAPQAPQITSRQISFSDTPEGDVAVTDFKTGKRISTVTGEAGFIRSTLRALNRERKSLGLPGDAAFTLTAHSDGRMTLDDPSTSKRIHLESFGPTNAASFAQFLDLGQKSPVAAATTTN